MATVKNAPAEQEREHVETRFGNTTVFQTKDGINLSVSETPGQRKKRQESTVPNWAWYITWAIMLAALIKSFF